MRHCPINAGDATADPIVAAATEVRLRTMARYCPFGSKRQVVLSDPLSSNLHTEGNFQTLFSRRKSIGFNKLYRLTSSFFALRKYFDVQI